MRLTHRLALTAVFAGAAAYAQTSTGSTSTPPSSMHATATEDLKGAAAMTPSGVLSLIHQVNQDEIKLGKMAEAQAQNDKVKSYAKDMVDDHTALDKKLTDFVQKEGKGKLTLSASNIPAAKHSEMKSSTEKAEAKLKSASGATFDKEYMSAMLKGHDNVLADLDAQLPALKSNEKVHDFVADARDKVKTHRDHARDILSDLEKGSAIGGSGMQGSSTKTTMPGQSGAMNPGTTTPQSVGGGAPGATTGTSGTAAPGSTPSTTQPSTTGH